MGRFLTDVAHFPASVPLAGAVEYRATDGTPMTLALLQAFVENQGDAWTYTVDYLGRFLEEHRSGSGPPPEDAHGAYLALVHTLGMRSAELHRALAIRSGDPAFEPEQAQPRDLEVWKKNALGEMASTMAELERRRGELSETARSDADALLASRHAVERLIEASVPTQLQTLKTRFHGDYHLGQVLLRSGDFVIIDFEGEPARSLDERRAKHSPLRDVASMLRSFDYARHTALARATEQRKVDRDRLEPLAARWKEETCRVFLQAYHAGVRDGMLYSSSREANRLLRLFELEKAFYELRYELGNRPDWVGIPLRGILALSQEKGAHDHESA
jgi:maltose alpha-D-glucosyltransferase/alpha-amylase